MDLGILRYKDRDGEGANSSSSVPRIHSDKVKESIFENMLAISVPSPVSRNSICGHSLSLHRGNSGISDNDCVFCS